MLDSEIMHTTIMLTRIHHTLNEHGDLSTVENLTLVSNNYTDLDLSKMPNLKVLSLQDSPRYTAILKGTIENLTEMYLQNTNVIIDSTFSAPNLKKLVIYGMVSPMYCLEWLSNTRIEELYISSTKLDHCTVSLPESVVSLTMHNCSLNCDIDDILRLDQLPNLESINMCNNGLTGTINLDDYSRYKSVDLSHNKLKLPIDVPSNINIKSNLII